MVWHHITEGNYLDIGSLHNDCLCIGFLWTVKKECAQYCWIISINGYIDAPDIYGIQKRLAILTREINEELHAL